MLVSRSVSKDARNYHQFCTMFGLKQIMKSPTRITCRNTSLIDHILASIPSQISQHGVINASVSYHQLVYCTRQNNRIETGDVHKYISFCSFKKYTVDAYRDSLKKVNFPNCDLFKRFIYNNKYMIASTQMTNMEIFAFTAVLVFTLSSC